MYKHICTQTITAALQMYTHVNEHTCTRTQVKCAFDVWAVFASKCVRMQDVGAKSFGMYYRKSMNHCVVPEHVIELTYILAC